MTHYKITGGPLMAASLEWRKERAKQWQDRKDLAKEFGASGVYGNDQAVTGLTFKEGKEPKGWINVSRISRTCFRPANRSNAGKELNKRFETMPLNGTRQLQEAFGLPGLIIDHPYIIHISAEWPEKEKPTGATWAGEHHLLVSIPTSKKAATPWGKIVAANEPHVKEIKKSEYHAFNAE